MPTFAIELKPSLLAEPVFASLSDSAKRLLVERLSYILDICDKLDSFHAKNGIREFINDVELDAWVNVGAPGTPDDEAVSSWLVHASWTFDCQQPLEPLLAQAVAQRVTNVGDVSTLLTTEAWLKEQSATLRTAVQDATAASSLPTFVANSIAADALLLNLLVMLTRARLSARWLFE